MTISRNLSILAEGASSTGVLAVTNGGTGVTSTAAAPFALKGANADITSLTGLTTALSAAQGGTGLTAAGTNGNVLTSNGSTWVSSAPAGGGSMIFIASATPSSGNISFEGVFTGYDTFVIIGTNLVLTSQTDQQITAIYRFGTTYSTSNYYWFQQVSSVNNSSFVGRANQDTSFIQMYPSDFATTTSPLNFTMYITEPTSTTRRKNVYWTGMWGDYTTNGIGYQISTSNALTGIRFQAGIASGTCRLYGIKNS
jgi:hypothetical protein